MTDLSNQIHYQYLPTYYKNGIRFQLLYSAYATHQRLNASAVTHANNIIYDYSYTFNINNRSYTIETFLASVNTLYVGLPSISYNLDYLYTSGFYLELDFNYSRSNYTNRTYSVRLNEEYDIEGDLTEFEVDFSSLYSGTINPVSITLTLTPTEAYLNEYANSIIDYNFEEGYNQGYYEGTTDNSTPLNNGLGVLNTLFDSVGGVLNHEIMPNITIGGLVSIPLVFTIIVAIFKVVKG